MTIEIQTPDGNKFAFPDGTTEDVIRGAMGKHFGTPPAAAPVPAAAAPAGPAPEQNPGTSAGNALKGIPLLGAGVEPAESAIHALMQPLTGKGEEGATFSERYAKERKKTAETYEDYEKRNPVLAPVAQVGMGALATAPMAATALGARVLGLGARTLPGQVAAGAASGGAINALDAGLRGEDPGAAGAIGTAVGGAAPVVGRAIAPIANRIAESVRGITNPAEEAARRVGAAAQRDIPAAGAPNRMTEPEYLAAQAAGQPMTGFEMGGDTMRALGRSAANTSPQGREALNTAIDQRFEQQSTRVNNWLRTTFNYPDAAATQAALEQTARGTNSAAYRRAYQEGAGNVGSPELERLAGSDAVAAAMRKAATVAKDEAITSGYGAMNPRVTFTEDGRVQFNRGPTGVPTYPDLQFWDLTRRQLSDAAQAAGRGTDEARRLGSLARAMNTELDRLVPSYQTARRTAASFFGSENALEAGQAFVNSKLSNSEVRQGLARMSDTERQLFQDGFVDSLVRNIREMPLRRSVLNFIKDSPAWQERLQIALGRRRAAELQAMLHVEHIMDLARPSLQGNSTTARQLTELGLAGGAGTIVGEGNPLDPQAVLSAALVYGAARGRHAINERVARQVAELIASGDHARIAQGMRLAGQDRVLDALRIADTALARAGGVQAEPRRQQQPATVH